MFFEQLTKACKKQGKTVTAVAKELEISKSNVTNWKNGTIPNGEVVVRLSELLGVTADYLLKDVDENNLFNISEDEKELLNYYKELNDLDKGSILGKAEGLAEAARRQKALAAAPIKKAKPKVIKPPEPELTDEPEDEEEEDYIYLDFPDLPVSAGTGVYLHDDSKEQLKVRSNGITLRANYVLRIHGDSMEPEYHQGDIVAVRTQPMVEEGEVGIFILNNEAFIKKLGRNRLISLNSEYPDKIITEDDDIYCKGKVMGIIDTQDIVK